MVIDASVWVAAFLSRDVHHGEVTAFLRKLIEDGLSVTIPVLALCEIAGAIGRQTTEPELAEKALGFLLAQSWIRFAPLNESLAAQAASLAARQRLRGADAVYVALAAQENGIIITLDREMLERTPDHLHACTPSDWLKHN